MNYTQELIRENVFKLREIIENLTYKPKWGFGFSGGVPEKFVISIECEDSTGRHDPYFKEFIYDRYRVFGSTEEFKDPQPFGVSHHFDIPPHDLPYQELERWVLERIMDVDRHEAMEFFKINGKAVFMPDHSDVTKLYSIHRR